MNFGIKIGIEFLLKNKNCKNDLHQIPFEIWNLKRNKTKPNGPENGPNFELLPLFLKQAIRSQLHFSPINSWLAQKGDITDDLVCDFKILTSPKLVNKFINGIIETHTFPLCKFETEQDTGNYEYLEVEVQWIRSKEMPILEMNCCQKSQVEFSVGDETTCDIWNQSDSIQQSSTEDDDGTLSLTSFSSTFSTTPPNEMLIDEKEKIIITEEKHVEMMKELLIDGKKKRIKKRKKHVEMMKELLIDGKKKRIKKRSLTKNEQDDEDEEAFENEKRIDEKTKKLRKSRRCKTTSDSDENNHIFRSRNSKSFCTSSLRNSETILFNPRTRLPVNSSPSPLKRTPMIKNLATKLKEKFTNLDGDSSSSDSEVFTTKNSTIYGSHSSSNALLCNFEESALNGRLDPISCLDGFQLQLAISGSFSVPHTMIPVSTYFFNVSDDNAPSLYLGHCSLKDAFGRKSIHIPKKCIVQATLFNPQGSVVRIFIVKIDCHDIPPKSRTFIRQRTYAKLPDDDNNEHDKRKQHENHLRYLINLRLATNRTGKLYLHTDIRLLFSNKTDLDVMNLIAEYGLENSNNGTKTYELMTNTEMPQKPKYSPIK
uniref:Atos-like conserved domain-containing protein n=1 Tax=Panagrolaimus sp. JU765 TaxID=591449 RepID=A0AC34Q6Q6_9BILA